MDNYLPAGEPLVPSGRHAVGLHVAAGHALDTLAPRGRKPYFWARAAAAIPAGRRELLAVESALWTLVEHEGVEPTNNLAGRMLRPMVLWRKGSFGCQSEAGCRFAERMLTMVQTLHPQRRSVPTYLQKTLYAHRKGLPTPKLLPTG